MPHLLAQNFTNPQNEFSSGHSKKYNTSLWQAPLSYAHKRKFKFQVVQKPGDVFYGLLYGNIKWIMEQKTFDVIQLIWPVNYIAHKGNIIAWKKPTFARPKTKNSSNTKKNLQLAYCVGLTINDTYWGLIISEIFC